MKYFKILSPPQIAEDLKALLNQVYDQFEDKEEFSTNLEGSEDTAYEFELSISVSQSCKIPLIAEMANLPDETRKLILLILLENRYFLKTYQYELIAAVITSLTKDSLPLSTETFLDHYDISWKQAFPLTGKSKSVWLFHYDCRFWLMLLRIIVKSIEQYEHENEEHLCDLAFDQVLKFKNKFKGYGHFPEVSPLVVTLIKKGSPNIIEKLKDYSKDTLPRVYKQFGILQRFSNNSDKLICLFLQAYGSIPSEKWLKSWKDILGSEDKDSIKRLCDNLWQVYMPTKEECRKLAHLSGGTLDMEVILGIQRQLYQDFQDMTEYEEFGRNITRAAIWSMGLLERTSIVDELYDFCKQYYQFKEFCKAAIHAIENIHCDESLKVLQKVQRLVKDREVKKVIHSALQKQGARLGLSVDILNDLTTDDCGLDINGIHSWILGRDFIVKLILFENGDSKLEYIDRKKDETYDTSPELLRKKYEDEYNSAQEIYTLLKDTIKIQSQRLEEAMCQQRSWETSLWKDIFEINPVNRNLARRLLWSEYDKKGNLINIFLPLDKDNAIDINDNQIAISENSNVKLFHPVLVDSEQLKKWNEVFKKKDILQPFPQIERKIYFIEESEKGNEVLSKRFFDSKVPFNELQEKMIKLSWSGFGVSDFDESSEKYKDYNYLGWRSFISIDLTGINIWTVSSDVHIKDIYFSKLIKRGKGFKSASEKSLLKDVNPIVYSETMKNISVALLKPE